MGTIAVFFSISALVYVRLFVSCDFAYFRLLWTILLLLNDEDADTRDIACKIVATLAPQSQESSEVSFPGFFRRLCQNVIKLITITESCRLIL